VPPFSWLPAGDARAAAIRYFMASMPITVTRGLTAAQQT